MLTVDNVTKCYGKKPAVVNISLSLGNGLYGLLAPNGAGKTTLIKMLTTLLTPTSGEILYCGTPIEKLGAEYRGLIGYLPQQFGYYRGSTPVRYLEYLAALKGMPEKGLREKIDKVIDEVGLTESKNIKMKKFSGGMLQRVGIAQAVMSDPKILILDEPTAGLDPKERVRFRNIISAMSKDRTVILSTHIVSDIESIANRVVMIKDRKIFRDNTVPEVSKELEGQVYETSVPDGEYEAFEREYFVLSARQEQGSMAVRFYSPSPAPYQTAEPDLEDFFLVTYR